VNRRDLIAGEPDFPAVSARTALFCLGRLNGRSSEAAGVSTSSAGDNGASDVLSVKRLIEIARAQGYDTKPIRLGWQELRAAAMAEPVLLVLRNGNVVIAVQSGPKLVEELIASDPLYLNGEDFFLPRGVLEAAWDGAALILKPLPLVMKTSAERLVSTLSYCAVVAVIGLFLFYPKEAGQEAAESEPKQAIARSKAVPRDPLNSLSGKSTDAAEITSIRPQGSAEAQGLDAGNAPMAAFSAGASPFSTDTLELPRNHLEDDVVAINRLDTTSALSTDTPKSLAQSEPDAIIKLVPASDPKRNLSATVLRGAPVRH